MELLAKLPEVLRHYGPTALVAVILVGFIIFLFRVLIDEDRSAFWRGQIFLALYKISGKREAEKKYIANNINGQINLARRKLHFGQDAIPSSISVEWVESGHEGAYDVAEGEFVVRLDPSAGQDRNIAKLATTIVGRTTLIGIRHLVERPLEVAVDLNLVRNLLFEIGDRRFLDWFLREEYGPATAPNDIRKWNEKIVEIDDRGLFTRVLLVTLEDFGRRIAGMAPRPYMSGEIEQLIQFLYRIATKELGEDVPLRFVRAHMKIGVILVARTSKLLNQGIEPYIKAMNFHVEEKVNVVYVIVFDKELLRDRDEEAHEQFVRLTQELDREFLNSSAVVKEFSFKYSCRDAQGNTRKAICTRYSIKSVS